MCRNGRCAVSGHSDRLDLTKRKALSLVVASIIPGRTAQLMLTRGVRPHLFLDSSLHHDQFRGWIDADALAVGADERELAPVSRNSYSRTSAWLCRAQDRRRTAASSPRLGGDRAITRSAASARQMGRFETKWLSRPENLTAPADLPGQWIGNAHQGRPPKTIVLDMDSSGSREPDLWSVGRQCLQRAFRLHLLSTPFVFNQFGDVERCAFDPVTSLALMGLARSAGAGRHATGTP